MKKIGDEIHIETDEARGGSTPHIVRYVLAASLVLAIIAMSVIWISRALYERPAQGDPVSAVEHALGR